MLETGYFLCGGGPKKYPARITRPCRCTVNGGSGNFVHTWRDSCDRFQPYVAEVAGSTLDPAGNEIKPENIWRTATPLIGQDGLTDEQEYSFLCAEMAHKAKHGRQKRRKAEPIEPPKQNRRELEPIAP